VHSGDPSTLLALFVGELWRGRNNLRVTLRARRNWRTLRSALVPVLGLSAPLLAAVFFAAGWPVVALLSASVFPLLAAARAIVMVARDPQRTIVGTVQSFVIAVVYDAARALAIPARTSHHMRRAVDPHVTADSHS
jgi:hypothetical protein